MCVVHWRGIHGGNVCALTVHVHSQSEGGKPCNIACCNLVLPLSSQVMLAIVRLVVVTVTLASVMGTPLLVSVISSLVGGGLVSMKKESVSCPPSVGAAMAVDGENSGGSTENSETI